MISTSYSYYTNIYKGTLSQEDFDKENKKAGYVLDNLTFGRYRSTNEEDVSNVMATDVRELTCNVIDKLASVESENKELGINTEVVKSFKSGSTSMTFATGKELGASTNSTFYGYIRNLIDEYCGKYGWSCRWV